MAEQKTMLVNESVAAGHPVGKALIVYGDVQAINDAGMARVLTPNSPIFQGERIVTGSDGAISVLFDDGHSQLDLGKFSDVKIDAEVYSQLDHSEIQNAITDVNAIQQALADNNFDPTTDLDPTAAGPAANGGVPQDGGGHETVEFTPDGLEVTPDSGAETIGVPRDFLSPPIVNIVDEEITTIETPVVTTTAAATPTVTSVTPGPPVTPPSATMADPDETLTVSEIAPLMGNEPQTISGNLLANTTNATDPIISEFTILDASGVEQTYTLVAGASETVDVFQDGLKTGTLTISSNGDFTYNLDNHADHSISESYGGNDTITLPSITYEVTDTATGQTDTSTLTIIIEDGEPTVEVLHDAILANEHDNCVVGHISVDYGADGPATLVDAMQLLDADGNSLIGQTVVDINGNEMTANGGESLIYVDNGAGGVLAVIDDGTSDGGGTVFEVSLTLPADGSTDATYTVTLDAENTLDNQTTSHIETTTTTVTDTVSLIPGSGDEHADSLTFTSASGDLAVTVTGEHEGSSAEVYANDTGLGVEGGTNNDGGDPDYSVNASETLTLSFTDPDTGDSLGLSNVSFTVTGIDGVEDPITEGLYHGDSISWTAYTIDDDGNSVEVSSGSYDAQEGDPDSQTFSVTGDDITSVEISITDGDNKWDEIQVSDITGDHTETEDHTVIDTIDQQSVSYSVEVTDSDEVAGVSTGDHDTSDPFTVTFDSDGDITGTDANETISGSSGDDTIDGGGGDDIIFAHDGNDTVSGGDGNDTICGGSGDDQINGDAGNDVIGGGTGTDTITTGEGEDTVAQTEFDNGEITDFDSSSDTAVSNSDMSNLLDDSCHADC